MDIRLDDKVAIITGGNQGLGRVMAFALARAGARVVLAARDAGQLDDTAAAIEDEVGRGRAIGIRTDITDRRQCEGVTAETLKRFGGVHILVNGARRRYRGPSLPINGNALPFWESNPDIWEENVRVSIIGLFFLSRTVAPHLIQQKWGRIINLSTSLGSLRSAGGSPYGLSKMGVEAATVIWSKDLAGTGVTVNSLLPGGSTSTDPTKNPGGVPLLPPEVIIPPLVWLASSQSDGKSGGRYVGKLWDPKLPLEEAAQRANEPVDLYGT